MKFSKPRLGGSALDALVPGWQDKLWARLHNNVKTLLIKKQHYDFESYVRPLSSGLRTRAVLFHENVSQKLRPSEASYPVVDYRRQMARGTFVGGSPFGAVKNRIHPKDPNHVFAPFSAEEEHARRKFRNFSIPLLIAAAFGSQYWFNRFQSEEPYGVYCLEYDPPHVAQYPFWMKSMFHSHDVRAVRRGYEVYRNVCATCHSMKYVAYRHLTYDNMLPEARVKELAAAVEVVDGPNDEGEMFERPGTLLDHFPSPYPNPEAARFANGGAEPPDLSVYAGAKHGGIDYIFGLLTGYREPPAGVTLRNGLYYNTMFPGGTIAMAPPLEDEMVEYEDGTPATVSQMAKDVASFMAWAMDPSHDSRKLSMLKSTSGLLMAIGTFGYWYRWHWASIRTRIVSFPKLRF